MHPWHARAEPAAASGSGLLTNTIGNRWRLRSLSI
jgi:hypothetical protein